MQRRWLLQAFSAGLLSPLPGRASVTSRGPVTASGASGQARRAGLAG